ncbi:MAG: diaminopimelate epimerase [Clostridia bacterium]
MNFTKMHGAGNDYVYVNCFVEEVTNPEKLAIDISDRHFGVGSDGLVLILPSKIADAKMRMFNADGSEGEMCGNAIRCVGKYLYDNAICKKEDISIETLAGTKLLKMTVENGIATHALVDMGIANFIAQEIPVDVDSVECIDHEITVLGKTYQGTAVSMGNPHFVIVTQDVANLDLLTIGTHFENHKIFPKRINTEFVEIIDKTTVSMRVWERGSGETLACGTGACATVAGLVKKGILQFDTENTVKLLGGELVIRITKDFRVFMTGKATKVFDGVYKSYDF